MTPAERARAWYPTASAGGGNNMAVYDGVGHKLLWKPVSDSTKKCAVHTPAGLRIRSLTVAGKEYGVGSYGNGWRPLFRLDKAGASYGANVPVVLNLHDGRAVTVLVPSGGKKFEKAFDKPSDTTTPDLPLPGQKPPAAKDVSEIMIPASYAADVRLVVAVVGGKLKACVPGDTSGRKWVLSGRMGAGDFFAVAWATVPAGLPVVRHALLGAWSYTDRKTWTDDFRTFGQAAPVPVDPPNPPNHTSLFVTTPNSLTLRSDFAAAVGLVKVLVKINDPHRPGSVGGTTSTQVIPTRSGNTWTLPQPLAPYPSGNVPNTWAYKVTRRLPAGATYHIDLGYGFIRSGDNPFGPGNKTYPPTTR